MAGTAVRGRLSWQTATVGAVVNQTPTARTLLLDVPDWPGHRAGQHVDIRLTAEDGYRAERAYPYLTQEAQPGDSLEVRGPIGGYFVWEPAFGGPLLLLAGGSGIVPLRAILRYRDLIGSSGPARLLYSSRRLEDVIYRDELSVHLEGLEVIYALTRSQPEGWAGYARRVDDAMLADVAWPAADKPLAYVCGPTSFVETAAAGLVGLGYPPVRVRTERFGATGQ